MNKFFLLADDDSDDADMFREVLSEIDPSILFHRTWDGEEVFDKLNDKSLKLPTIIFLDINMPGMNGWQCLAKLKSSEVYKDIPVIMYSTSTHQRDAEIAFDLGAACFISKPDDFKKLKKILKIIVENVDNLDTNLSETLRNISNIKEIKCLPLEEQGITNRRHRNK